MSSWPKFAVVGHPNKGKSSIVSTLSQNDLVDVGEDPGTTKTCSSYKLKLHEQVLFELIDTPGFQRPRKVFQAIKSLNESVGAEGASGRPEAVKRFIEKEDSLKDYPDEVELLKPIVDGAGILYVVDGSSPYGPEYDSELEILRWTGQPSMALINPIGDDRYVQEWKTALGQFFNVVRVFNAKSEEFTKQIELFSAFSELKEEWREPITKACDSLLKDREQKLSLASENLSELLFTVLSEYVEQRLSSDSRGDEALKSKLSAKLKDKIVESEQNYRKKIESLFRYSRLSRVEDELDLLNESELFSEESWKLFGLKKKELLTLGAIGGAAAGGSFDVLSGGSSLLMGSVVGGLVGFGTALFAGEKLVDTKVVFLPLGERLLKVGPIQDLNLPFVVLERARLHYSLISKRTHAERGELDLKSLQSGSVRALSMSEKKEFEKVFRKLRKSTDVLGNRERLSRLIEGVL